MRNYHSVMTGIVMLAMITELVTTPEQRAQWARENDWETYASRFSD